MRILPIFTAALAATLTLPAIAHSQTPDTEQVSSTVRAYMAAFDDQDAEAMGAFEIDGAHLLMVREGNAERETVTRSFPLSDANQSVANSTRDLAEPIAITAVLVEGPVAMVWADYSLFVDGTRSHCGIDIFTLLRVDDEWKIASITYSHIDAPCENAPGL